MRKKVLIPIVFTLIMLAMMAFQAKTVTPVLCDIPSVTLTEIPGFTAEFTDEMSEAEKYVLPEDTIVHKAYYTSDAGKRFNVTMVIGGKSKSSIHRPELCLPTQGFQMMSPRDISVGGISWHVLTLEHGSGARSLLAYTFFNQAGYHTSSHVLRIFRDVWDRSILGRIDRWVMLEVETPICNDAELSMFLRKVKGTIL